jgi:hypothetical protein
MNQTNHLTTVAVFFVLLLYGCGQKEINSHEIIHLENILDNFVTVNLSEFTDSIEYIKLETNDQAVISRIKHIDIRENLILIQDFEDNCILYNENGKFLSRIGKKGNGPGEYVWLLQGKIGNHVVFVLTYNKILTYNFKGEFLQEINIPYQISAAWLNNSFFPTSDTTFLLQVPFHIEGNQLAELNLNGSVIKKYFKQKSETIRLGTLDTEANIYIHEGKYSYKCRLNDTLFRIHNTSISPEYTFDFGKYSIPPAAINLKFEEYIALLTQSMMLQNFIETTNYFFLTLALGANSPKEFVNEKTINNAVMNVGYRWLGVYNKEYKSIRLSKPSGYKDELNYTGIYNDLDGGLSVFPRQRIDDSSFVTWFYPYELKSYTSSAEFRNKKVKNQKMKDRLLELSKSLSFDDNPVLMKVKLRN